MAIDFVNPLTAGTVLVRSDIRSQNFVTGVSGWRIEADGDAEFNNLTIRGEFLGTNFILNSDGLFLYSGTPALGNLIANITSGPGTDGFGNTYLAGVVSYSGPVFASLNDSNLLLGLVTQALDAGVVGLAGGGDEVFFSSPSHLQDPATMALVAGLVSVTPISAAGYPHLDIGASSAGTAAWINGPLIRSFVSAGVSSPETWHAPSYAANWAGTTTFTGVVNWQTLRMRLDGEDNVWYEGAFTCAAGAGSTAFTAPAGYYNPNQLHGFPVMERQAGGGAFQVGAGYMGTTGNFHIDLGCNFTRNAGDVFYVNAKIPLGNIG